MISGDEVNVRTATFQNDMITFRNKDDVLTLLVHLGYLAYNQSRQTAYIPNEEIRMEFIDAVEDNKWSELIEFEISQNSFWKLHWIRMPWQLRSILVKYTQNMHLQCSITMKIH